MWKRWAAIAAVFAILVAWIPAMTVWVFLCMVVDQVQTKWRRTLARAGRFQHGAPR